MDTPAFHTYLPAKSSILWAAFITFILVFCVIVINDQPMENKRIWKEKVQGSSNSPRKDNSNAATCKNETLPRGIVQKTSDLQLRSMGEQDTAKKHQLASQRSLLAIACGIKQKENIDKIVQKFPAENFTIMLFHYDGVVDEWSDLSWSHTAIHIAALKQTKWWFAKRFLHPDIVAPYNYIFVWDEDLGTENFDANRFLAIMQEEGLEISQPAVDGSSAHQIITIRNSRVKVHRRIIKNRGSFQCYNNSTLPPCTGFVEVMAPVFSRAAWKCVWNLIQNDLIQGWGLDLKLGYCAQGEPSEKVGVIDSEYIVHQAIPTLGFSAEGKVNSKSGQDLRSKVRRESSAEMSEFFRRWKHAVQEDKCWIDPYRKDSEQGST